MPEDQTSINNINDKLDYLTNKIDMFEGLFRVLIRSKLSNKLAKVKDEVERRGHMRTTDIMGFVDVARPTALTYMEKLGKELEFTYRKGEPSRKISGVIVYDKSKILQDRLQRLEKLFSTEKTVSFNQIMEEFGMGLPDAKDFAYYICDRTKKYKIKDGNKLERL